VSTTPPATGGSTSGGGGGGGGGRVDLALLALLFGVVLLQMKRVVLVRQGARRNGT
jgi:hypothetical protein